MVERITEKVRSKTSEDRAWRRFIRIYKRLIIRTDHKVKTSKASLIQLLGAWSEQDARKKASSIIGYVADTERTHIKLELLNPSVQGNRKFRFDNLKIELKQPEYAGKLPQCTIAIEKALLIRIGEVLGKVRGEQHVAEKYTYERLDALRLHRFVSQSFGLPYRKGCVGITRGLMKSLGWQYVSASNGETSFYRRIVRK